MTTCEHLNNDVYESAGGYTVAVCQGCGLMDVRSGQDDDNQGENAWSRDQIDDDLLSQHVEPKERRPRFTWWIITKAEFDALPAEIRELLSGAERRDEHRDRKIFIN